MAFTLTPLSIPNMRTDYGAENSAFANLGATLGNLVPEMRKQQLDAQKQQLLGQLAGGTPDYTKVGLGVAALGDLQGGAALIGLGQKAAERQQETEFFKGLGMGSGAAAPTAGASPVSVGNPTEIENRFMGGVRGAGLTNPYGLGAVAAYGRAESGFSPANANRVWNDPSESGAPGQAGGIMSWRAERLANLNRFAERRGERVGNISPETQAAFLVSEDPDLLPRLQNARSAEEANTIMANAWRFAGYDRPGGENARRLALTKHYSGRYGQSAPQGVQVAENEGDVQRLEAEMAARQGGGTQVAQADLPAAGASQAQGFAIPGTDVVVPQGLMNDPQVRRLSGLLLAAPTERTRTAIKGQLDLAVKDAERRQSESAPTEAVRNYRFYRQQEQAAGREPMSFQAFRESTANRTNVNVGGGSDKQIFDNIEKGAEAAGAAAVGLQSIREARRAVEGGGYFGAGADLRLGLQKAAQGLGIGTPEALNKIVNTETFRSAIAPQIAATMKATVGSTQISNADRDFAEKASGGSIALDQKSITRLLGIMEKANRAIIEKHQKRLDTVYPEEGGKFSRERALFGVQAPIEEEPAPVPTPPAPPAPPAPPQRSQAAPMGQPTATGPNGQRMIFNGQAWVPLT